MQGVAPKAGWFIFLLIKKKNLVQNILNLPKNFKNVQNGTIATTGIVNKLAIYFSKEFEYNGK